MTDSKSSKVIAFNKKVEGFFIKKYICIPFTIICLPIGIGAGSLTILTTQELFTWCWHQTSILNLNYGQCTENLIHETILQIILFGGLAWLHLRFGFATLKAWRTKTFCLGD